MPSFSMKVRAEVEILITADGIEPADEVALAKRDVRWVVRLEERFDKAQIPAVLHDAVSPQLGVVTIDVGKAHKRL